MARQKTPEYMMATESFVTTIDGTPQQVSKGDLVHPDHPILRGRESLFAPAKGHVRFDVEQATAAPGEKRGAAEPVEHFPEGTQGPSMDEYTIVELKEFAKTRGVEGYSTMNKAELVKALEE